MSALVRVLVGALVLLVLFVSGEGALSLLGGTSWRVLLGPGGDAPEVVLERERALAARGAAGPYRVDEDPLVGHTLRPDEDLVVEAGGVATRVRSDALGLRAGREPAPDAPRVVLLGHAAVFGPGLRDEDTLAAELERALSARVGLPVACRAVALPRWNAVNAWRFLLDHLAELRPDVVLYLPGPAALCDGATIDDQGRALAGHDPAAGEPLRAVTPGGPLAGERAALLAAGLGSAARGRVQRSARALAHGATRAERAGARCALVLARGEPVAPELLLALGREGLRGPRALTVDAAGDEPAALAAALAEALATAGWLGGGPESEPATPDLAELRRVSALRRSETADGLHARIDAAGGAQVLGGLGPGGELGPLCTVVLPRGRELRVRLEPLRERPDLYPLTLEVRVDGVSLGGLALSADGVRDERFALPDGGEALAHEVELVAPDWVVLGAGADARVAAARLAVLESVP